jgi:hypothetical protein
VRVVVAVDLVVSEEDRLFCFLLHFASPIPSARPEPSNPDSARGRRASQEDAMKKLLAICIMALATPASARPWAAFYCGELQVASVPTKYFDPEFGQCSAPV